MENVCLAIIAMFYLKTAMFLAQFTADCNRGINSLVKGP